MIFGNDRNALRQMWFDVYRKAQQNEALTDLEKQIREVIALHPEYHAALAAPEKFSGRDFLPEFGDVNPFLHMSLHMGLREQLNTDRPAGIAGLFRQGLLRHGDRHAVEHRCMDALAETMWLAQRAGTAPDEQHYLARLRQLLDLPD